MCDYAYFQFLFQVESGDGSVSQQQHHSPPVLSSFTGLLPSADSSATTPASNGRHSSVSSTSSNTNPSSPTPAHVTNMSPWLVSDPSPPAHTGGKAGATATIKMRSVITTEL